MTDGQKRYVSQQIALKTQKIMSLYNEYEEYDRTRVLPIPTYLDPQEFSPYSDYDDPLDKEEPDDSEGAKRRANKRNSDKSKVPAVVKETPQQREARKKNEKLKLFKFMDDIIFHEDFKAGTTFYEKELKWKHEEELARQGPAKAVSTEETDWTMEAVDDEDALQRQLDQDNLTKRK